MNLEPSFEQKATEALLDDVEEHAREELAPTVQQEAHDRLRAYGQRHDYNVETIIEAGETRVGRTPRSILVRWGWPEPAIFFERGTADGVTRRGDPLSFVWEDPPQWVREEFDREGDGWRVFLPKTEPSGLPESRFIRDTLGWLRRELQ